MSEITVWRLAAKRRVSTLWTGEGAFRRGARWSPPGLRAVYCAESRALAALEVLVHVEDVGDFVSLDWVIASATIPEDLIEHPVKFPTGWSVYPYGTATQEFGAEWLRSGRSAALRIPSAVVRGEFNYLLNPQHPAFASVTFGKATSFQFDRRLS